MEGGLQTIEVVTGGRGWVLVEGDWREVRAGDMLWHAKGDWTIGRSDFKNPYRCLAIRFVPRRPMPAPVPRLTHWEDLDEVKLFAHQMVHLFADGGFDADVLLAYILSRVRFQAELHLRSQKERGLPSGLRQVVEMVEHRFAEPLKLRELAVAAGWSVPHLHDRFRESLGISPHQALLRRRIRAARELLVSTNDPVKLIAGQCGFPNASALCVQFKKATRLSPKEYRRRQLFWEMPADPLE